MKVVRNTFMAAMKKRMDPERSSVKRRPHAVTAIGWFWIVVACMILIPPMITLLVLLTQGKLPEDFRFIAAPITYVFDHFGLVLVIQTTVGLVSLYTGVCLLRLAPWARIAAIVLSAVLPVSLIGMGMLIYLLPPEHAVTFSKQVTQVIVSSTYSIPFFLTLLLLFTHPVRTAFNPESTV